MNYSGRSNSNHQIKKTYKRIDRMANKSKYSVYWKTVGITAEAYDKIMKFINEENAIIGRKKWTTAKVINALLSDNQKMSEMLKQYKDD